MRNDRMVYRVDTVDVRLNVWISHVPPFETIKMSENHRLFLNWLKGEFSLISKARMIYVR